MNGIATVALASAASLPVWSALGGSLTYLSGYGFTVGALYTPLAAGAATVCQVAYEALNLCKTRLKNNSD